MSNDLISKKSLLKNIDEVIKQYSYERDGAVLMDVLTCVRDMVSDMPTAYDIDNVIDEVEALIDFEFDWLSAVKCEKGRITLVILDVAERAIKSKAIEIVKKGGRNEK